MEIVDGATVARLLAFPDLCETLRAAFAGGIVVPTRHHHALARPGAADATLLLMPAWTEGAGRAYAGVKIVSVFPDNPSRGKPSVMGSYLLLSGETGEPLAMIDGEALTLRRTAAASALAAGFLARPDARRMLMVGAGALAPGLIEAHAAVRPLAEVAVWNRSPEKAAALAAALDRPGLRVVAAADLAEAVAAADIVSVATTSAEPLVRGAWLRPGTHLDLVGAYRPAMRESDDEAVRQARIFVDTRAGALAEAGDILQPLRAGVIGEGDVVADLFALCRGEAAGRRSADEITLFKSVGTALEDLAAAIHVHERHRQERGAAG